MFKKQEQEKQPFMKKNIIFENITSILAGNPALAADFMNIVKEEVCPKNHVLHHSGDICHRFFILRKGISRVFYYKEEKDITSWFSFENEIFTAIDSFFQEKKSKYSIEILEEGSVVWSVKRSDMEPLFVKHPDFERLVRLFFQEAYVDLADRIDSLQFHSAQERYQLLLEKNPNVLQRVPLGHVASYLGMTQETLSRVRSKIN